MSTAADTTKPSSGKTLRRGARVLMHYLAPFRRQLIVLGVLGVVSAIAAGLVPYLVGRFFDALVNITNLPDGSTLVPIFGYLGLWLIVQLVANTVDWIDDRLRRTIDTRIHLQIQNEGVRHLLRLPLSFHKSERIPEILEKFNRAGWMGSNIVQTIVNITPQFLSIIVGISVSFLINPYLAFILIAGVSVYVVIMVRVVRAAGPAHEEGMRAWSEAWGRASSAVQQTEGVKQASAERYEEKSIAEGSERSFQTWFKMERIWSNVGVAQRILVMLTQLSIFAASVYLVSHKLITPGELVALNGYALMFFGPFVQLGYSWQSIQNGLTAAAETESILAAPTEIYHPTSASKDIDIKGEITFSSASFNYGGTDKPVLFDVSFVAKRGMTVALVGESGVGKSTLISLISAYYFPTKGDVLVDGISTRNIDLEALRRQIAVVPQEVALFNDTIEMNIRYGSFEATHEDIVRAAGEAQIAEFIDKLPKKYQTIVGERGVKLSVGQKQRVAIARALLRDPKILILDEPTSALDSQTEKLLTTSLEKLMEGRTTFIIAHRLSTVRGADLILVLEGGTIVESGTHKRLLTKKGVYKRLYDLHIGLHE